MDTGGSVAENAAAGTVVATLTAVDVDGDALTYTITDAGGTPVVDANFEIVGDEIRVKAGADVDFEAAASHDLHIVASDAFESAAPQAVTVTVTDVAEVITLGDGGVTFSDAGVAETSITGGTGGDDITAHDDGGTLSGAGGADTLTGGAGDDALDGGTGFDVLDGAGGDDVLEGGAGDDALDGGADDDRAVYQGDLADFSVVYDAGTDTFTISDLNTGDGLDEGTDTVTNVETFSFNGTDYTKAELETEAARQANTGPGQASVDTGGSVAENAAGARWWRR